jgi:hypothetical protein
MGSRPSSFKKGGGFLNGVDGVITGYRFTDEFNGESFVPGKDPKTKKERFHSLFCEVSVRVDGADEDVNQHLFSGGYDDFEISEDGLTLTAPDGGECTLGQNTGTAKFFGSLVAANFPEENFSDDPNSVNFEPAVGTRVRFVQRKDEESTRKLGKRKDKKTGKEYDRTDLVVDQVYELPGAPVAAAAKTAVKPNGKVAGKAAKAPAVPTDIDALGAQTVVEIALRAGKPVAKSKFSMESLKSAVLKTAEAKDHREAVRKRIFEDDFLTALADGDGVEYEGTAYNIGFNKAKGIVTVTEA